jgi:nitrite reductase (NADH) small subunit
MMTVPVHHSQDREGGPAIEFTHQIGSRLLPAETPFTAVGQVGEVPEGEGRPFEVEGRMIAVFLQEGTYYAMDDCCPHQGAPLSDGVLCDKTVTCSWHGWRFSLEDGKWLDSPRTSVATYPVRVVEDRIEVAVPA